MHALARDVFYGNRGRINSRELWGADEIDFYSCDPIYVVSWGYKPHEWYFYVHLIGCGTQTQVTIVNRSVYDLFVQEARIGSFWTVRPI